MQGMDVAKALEIHRQRNAELDAVEARPCDCGLQDCELLAAGYHYCSADGEHHRPPVATPAEPWCPVDFNSAVMDELDRLPADAPADYDAAAAMVRERFVAALS
jgi:hypothetical protein